MPTRVEASASYSWTDDLPVCLQSGMGMAVNQIYRQDGQRVEDHECEDKSFRFCIDENTFLYGIFDGHDGKSAAEFAYQRMPAELLLDQLDGKTCDEDIKQLLHHSFDGVERAFMDSIAEPLARRTELLFHLPEGISSYETYRQYPEIAQQLRVLEQEIAGGATAVVALIHHNHLYVANVGDCRALLCTADPADGVLRVLQLTVEHTINNEDELLRLAQLGLSEENIRKGHNIGNREITRSIGDYNVKGGYKDFESLKDASSEPVIAEPDVHGGMPLEDNCRFLLLMSSGLHTSLQLATGKEHVNKEIASMVAQEFPQQQTVMSVAQAVVDKIVRIHHDAFMTKQPADYPCPCQRDDVTLLVRNFNYPLAASTPSGFHAPPVHAKFTGIANTLSPRNLLQSGDYGGGDTGTLTNTISNTYSSSTASMDGGVAQSHAGPNLSQAFRSVVSLPLDMDGRIAAYVDFSDFYRAVAEAGAHLQHSQVDNIGVNGVNAVVEILEDIEDESGHEDAISDSAAAPSTLKTEEPAVDWTAPQSDSQQGNDVLHEENTENLVESSQPSMPDVVCDTSERMTQNIDETGGGIDSQTTSDDSTMNNVTKELSHSEISAELPLKESPPAIPRTTNQFQTPSTSQDTQQLEADDSKEVSDNSSVPSIPSHTPSDITSMPVKAVDVNEGDWHIVQKEELEGMRFTDDCGGMETGGKKKSKEKSEKKKEKKKKKMCEKVSQLKGKVTEE